ncbi:MAG: DNA polymerase I [Patescibacteria group bacterium]
MSKTKPKLIIIDGNALIHRSFHALPPTLRTKNGLLVNAVYGFTSFLLKALSEFKPEYVVLTLDKKDPTFRHETYSDYKATRVKAPDELYEQIPVVKKVATAFNIPIFELSGYEADDLIGTICEQTKLEKNLEKIIITGDLDTLQLVNEKTKVYTMSRGLSDSVLYGPEQIHARYGLRPDQIIDYKALRGDPSDNIPGVKGIGEKTASELLIEFGNLAGVYKAVKNKNQKIKNRILELLKEHQANAYLSQDLATIRLNAPLKFSLTDIKFSNFQLETVLTLFSELEFKSLLNKVKDVRDNLNQAADQKNQNLANKVPSDKNLTTPIIAPSGQAKFSRNAQDFNYQLIDFSAAGNKKFTTFYKKLKTRPDFTIDSETSGLDPLSVKLIGLSFSWQVGAAYFVLINKERLEKLRSILENNKIEKFGHNLKFDYRILKNQGIQLRGLTFDTMLASYLLNPASRQHNLDNLVFTEFGFEKISKKDLAASQGAQLALNFSALDPEKLSLYSCEDADFTNRLVKSLAPKLKTAGLEDLFKKIEMPLVSILGDMENNGIKLDPTLIDELNQEISQKIKSLEKNIYQLAKTEFNINSTKQLKEVLFTKLDIPTTNLKRTKTGFSTAEDELIKLHDLHPIISPLQEYRELNKLQTTYLNALPKMINLKTGRLHTSFNQTITATGRLSSNDPNLQNIPTRGLAGQKIRRAFIAETGWRLLGLDYSQIELRLAAAMSGDKKMITAFKAGADIHTATAAEINGVKLNEVTKAMRRAAKATNFGILYGQGAHGLSQNAGIPYWQASEFIKKYWLAYPGIKKMMDDFIKKARSQGYALTLFGRRRPLPELNSSIAMIKKSAERMAINAPIQGTAADIIKLAMIKIATLISDAPTEIRLLLQVHDELIFEIKKDKLDYYAPKIQNIMGSVLKLQVPIKVEINQGDNWGDLK